MDITAILIDDEKPSLRILEILLHKYPDITIIGSYTNPELAIIDIYQLKPKAVFLDISMPQMNGVDVASQILDACPGTDIIFVTAYDEYAIEAFEINAIDYLLKPVKEERLDKTVSRLLNKQSIGVNHKLQKLQINCLGSFQLQWDNQEPIKWRAEKTKELFAFLLHHKGSLITKDMILDNLWPHDNPDKAIRQLYNGIYYIRKALEDYLADKIVIQIDSNYNLTYDNVDYDVDHFYSLKNSVITGNFVELEKMENLYTGEYFQNEDYPWAYAKREELANLYQECLIRLATHYIENYQYDMAEKKLRKAYEIDAYGETVTELLMRLYMRSRNKNKGIIHFHSYMELLRNELGIKPDAKLMELYQAIKLM